MTSIDSKNELQIPILLPLYSRDYLLEHELFDVPEIPDVIDTIDALDLPDDLEDCRQVAQIVIPDSIVEIYYNYVLETPLVQFHNDWIYFGNKDTTIRQLLTHFGIINPILTWIESPYDIDDNYLDDLVYLSPIMIFETDEDGR